MKRFMTFFNILVGLAIIFGTIFLGLNYFGIDFNPLKKSKLLSFKKHFAFVEIEATDFLITDIKEKDDSTSTKCQLEMTIQNIGKEEAYIEMKTLAVMPYTARKLLLKAPEFHGKVPISAKPKKLKPIAFVMNIKYDIPSIRKDGIFFSLEYSFKNLNGNEFCDVIKTWKFHEGKFTLMEDIKYFKNKSKRTDFEELLKMKKELFGEWSRIKYSKSKRFPTAPPDETKVEFKIDTKARSRDSASPNVQRVR